MPIEQYTYWSMTINNPEENDYVLVRNPNSKYIRELVWTKEIGEEGTEHIQAWIRLQRNQTLSFVKKLYPRAHLKNCDKDMYNENCHSYAQKNDNTTAGNHHITLNDPMPDAVVMVMKVLAKYHEDYPSTVRQLVEGNDMDGYFANKTVAYNHLLEQMHYVENDMVEQTPALAKLFVSPVYERTLKRFWKQFLRHLINGGGRQAETSDGREEGDGDSDEEGSCETDEGHEQSASDQSDEEDASSECGE